MAMVRIGNDWAGILPDILANIFCRLSLQDRLCMVPRVCKQWKLAAESPACWQIIDLSHYLTPRLSIDKAHARLKLFLKRSHGLLTYLNYPYFMDNNSLVFIANSFPLLEVLHMPNCTLMTDDWVAWIAPMFRSITDLDLSSCGGLSHVALEAVGKNCRKITHLRRNRNFFFTRYPRNEEAFAIAQHFPHLQHLEVANAPFSMEGLRAIFDGCGMLTSLDLRGHCQHLGMSEVFIMECKQRLNVFLEPGDDYFLMLDLQGPVDAR